MQVRRQGGLETAKEITVLLDKLVVGRIAIDVDQILVLSLVGEEVIVYTYKNFRYA